MERKDTWPARSSLLRQSGTWINGSNVVSYERSGNLFDRRSHNRLIREKVKSEIGITRPRPLDEIARHSNDRFRLRHVVTNLVANAIDHGGSSIAINGVAQEGWYHCSVIDDGSGVAPAMVDKLFSRYVHDGANPLLVGTVGLGLAVAQTLLRQMGGDIRYERLEGLTIFHFRIPLAESRSPAVVESASV